MSVSFSGKRALVTGASRGIGRTIAVELAKSGAHVFALARSTKSLEELSSEHSGIHAVTCDLSNWSATEEAVKAILPIHLLVNNAGIALLQSFVDVDEEALDFTLNLNVKTPINVSRVVARDLISRGSPGSIVNVSSQASLMALTNHTTYCASKAALDSVTRSMALELGPKNIRINSVNPTVVLTEMGKMGWSDPAKAKPMLDRIPMKRFAEEEEVSNAVLFLLSDKASMINGTILPIDGGALISGP